MRAARLIAGESLCGFWGLFERDYGVPAPKPYPTVSPTRVGGTLLPFPCFSCGRVSAAMADPKLRERYRDRRKGQGNYWCPLCGVRFHLDKKGTLLEGELPAKAKAAPARVTRGAKTTTVNPGGDPRASLDVLGA